MRVKATRDDGSTLVLTSLNCLARSPLIIRAKDAAEGGLRLSHEVTSKIGRVAAVNTNGDDSSTKRIGLHSDDKIKRAVEDSAWPFLTIALQKTTRNGFVDFHSIIVGWTFNLATDQETEAEPIEDWARRFGVGASLFGFINWLASDADEPGYVRLKIAQEIIDGEELQEEDRPRATSWLAAESLKRFQDWANTLKEARPRPSEDPESVSKLARALLASELKRCRYKDAETFAKAKDPGKLWLEHDPETGWFKVPKALHALMIAWWDHEEREAWNLAKDRKPGFIFPKIAVLNGITAPNKPWRGVADSREVVIGDSGVLILHEGSIVSSAPIVPGIKADKLALLAEAFVDEIAIRLGVEFARRGADPRIWPKGEGRAPLEFTASSLLDSIGFSKDERTSKRLNDVLTAGSHYTYTIETVGKDRTETISGSFWDLRTVRYHDRGRRGEDRIIVSLGALFNPAVGMGALYVPVANPPSLQFVHEKLRQKVARLAAFTIPYEMTQRADEIALNGGMLFGPSEAESFGRRVGMKASKVVEAVNGLVDAGMFEMRDGRLNYADNEAYGMFRRDMIEKGECTIASRERGKKRAASKKAGRGKTLKRIGKRH